MMIEIAFIVWCIASSFVVSFTTVWFLMDKIHESPRSRMWKWLAVPIWVMQILIVLGVNFAIGTALGI